MRRQVKPFVTEYRATTRKPKDVLNLPVASKPVRDEPARSWAEMASESANHGRGGSDAMRAADAFFHRMPDEQTVPASQTEAGGPARRILESLEPDPASVQEAVPLESMPRRRGRKPGSKNKPKMPVASSIAIAAIPAPPPVAAQPLAPPTMSQSRARSAASKPLARRREAFSWVRKTLKPGERWKRRLPKVAW